MRRGIGAVGLGLVLVAALLVPGGPARSFISALDRARTALDEAWNQTGFTIERAVLVTGAAKGYGAIERRDDNRYVSGDTIYVYIEPIGYGYGHRESRHAFGFEADFVVRTETGQILGGQDGFAEFAFESIHRNREVYLDIEYYFPLLPPGQYSVETILHDRHGKQSTSAVAEFVIENGGLERRMREERL